MLQGNESQGAYEFPIISDAHITSEIRSGFGPYILLNPVSSIRAGQFRTAIVVRVNDFLVVDTKAMTAAMHETDEQAYHGAWLNEEIAALVSLALGIRAKAGGTSREFRFGSDPLGRPVGWDDTRAPLPRRADRLIVPNLVGMHTLDDLTQLALLYHANPLLVVALIRAARLYQDAVWICDAEPSLAWVLLVSAVEVAASYWRNEKESPVERMRASRPKLEELLVTAGGEELRDAVAEEIGPYMGATKTFLDFLLRFRPDPPATRPSEYVQVEWTDAGLKRVLNVVYKYRSRALHGGTPFPLPMCGPPSRLGDSKALSEIPAGGAMRAMGSTWVAKDTPMLLNTFEYIVRGALLRWWHTAMGSPDGNAND